jgi:precorrin-6B methylase 2
MIARPTHWLAGSLLTIAVLLTGASISAQTQTKPFEPQVGQPGKDVVWVPTPQELVDKMLDMAKLTPQDIHFDLGSGDGRTVITAAKRGATSTGIEYNPDMVELSQRNAKAAGALKGKATFMKADLFETDFSHATVITLFLLPSINMQLRPKILDMRPGTRIVSNSFTMEDWEADQTETVPNCERWCTALLWIVPAKAEGTWSFPQGALTINQSFQNFTGTFGSNPVTNGKLNGSQISFTAGGTSFTGTVNGNAIEGTMTSGGTKSNVRATKSR